MYLENVPDRLADYYAAEYYGDPTAEEFAAAARAHEGYKVELLQRFAQAGRLLDIGPARGGFAYLARESGFDVTVAEPDPGCCAFIAKRLGIRTVNSGDVVGVLAREEAFDVITLWHVIEHLTDPFAALAAAAGALRPGGVLIVAAPNPQALQLRVFGSRWTHVDAPRHLALIPLRVLEQRSGLRTLLRTTSDPGGIAWNAFGWRESLGNLTTVHVAGAALRRAGSALAVLAAPIERHGLCGAAYTVVFGA
ncbi:MAG: class I SAM-dependent methyltransferase [Gaiellaceae bacterium]